MQQLKTYQICTLLASKNRNFGRFDPLLGADAPAVPDHILARGQGNKEFGVAESDRVVTIEQKSSKSQAVFFSAALHFEKLLKTRPFSY